MTATVTATMPDRRISTHIPQSAYDEFMRLADEDGLTMSDRINALIDLWQTDADVRERAEAHARPLAAERRRRRYDRTRKDTVAT